MKEDISNGKNKQQPQFVLDPETTEALKKLAFDQTQEDKDPTKFTLLQLLASLLGAKFFTKYKNRDEIYQMNDILTHARLIPIVFGDSEGTRAIAKLYYDHADDVRTNFMSEHGDNRLALVHAVRNDNTVVNTESAIRKFVGAK